MPWSVGGWHQVGGGNKDEDEVALETGHTEHKEGDSAALRFLRIERSPVAYRDVRSTGVQLSVPRATLTGRRWRQGGNFGESRSRHRQ